MQIGAEIDSNFGAKIQIYQDLELFEVFCSSVHHCA